MEATTLITGGAGFIGSHLAQRLLKDGRRLLLVDNLSTGRRENVAHLLGERCQLVEVDAIDASHDDTLWQGVNRVFHLAASVGVQRVIDDPAAMMRNNILTTDAVLHAAGRHNASILIASSSEVYGTCPVLPLCEDAALVYGPTSASRWSYGMAKALDEHLALDLARRTGLQAVVVRLFNTIGPRQIGHYGMVVPRFVEQAVAGRPLTVYGDGQQTRAFCDVRDVTDALARLLEVPAASGHVFNVGSTHTVTIKQLAERILAAAGCPVTQLETIAYQTVYGDNFEDPPHRLPSVEKLNTAIGGFQPQWSLDATLNELIETAKSDIAPRGDAA
ncbi:MAG: NAD-dependent epimerase/dehydratase family protein [Algisphaera sp.]